MAIMMLTDVQHLEPILGRDVEVGMHLFTMESFPSGAVITFDGIVEEIEIQASGWRVAHLEGIPRDPNRVVPDDIEVALFRVIDPEKKENRS